MDNIWFKKSGWIYIPVHPLGLLVTFICLVLNIGFYVVIDRSSDSTGDTLIQFFIYFTCVAFWWKWIAEKMS
jgi:hypothetical protein